MPSWVCAFLDSSKIQKFFESEEGKREFEEWKAEQTELKRKSK